MVAEFAALAVPVIRPFEVLNVKPLGKAGDTAYVSVPVPPAAVTGVNGVTRVEAVTVLEATAWVVAMAPANVTVTTFVPVAPFVSVAVTVIV